MGCTSKVDLSNLVTYLNHTPRFERGVVWGRCNIKYHKDTHLPKIRLRVQKHDNHSKLRNEHDWGDLYMTFQRAQESPLQ